MPTFQKPSILNTFGILLNFAGLSASLVYYFNHRDSPMAFLGLGLMAGFLILSFIFKLIGYLFHLGLVLFLLAAGYFIFFKHEKPKDLREHHNLTLTHVFFNKKYSFLK